MRWAWLVLIVGCGDSGGSASTSEPTSTSTSADASSSSEDTGPVAPPGEFSFLTYNVAALPEGLSGSSPERYVPQISPLLNAFDLVVVQEDFWYHGELSADVTHPHQTTPWAQEPTLEDIGDGLNRFSIFELADHERIGWYDCHGLTDCASDCLATKGWSFARTTLAPGVEVDVYNLHGEAGGCPEDVVIRTQSMMELAAEINARSPDHAVIVAGDFNLRASDPEDVEPLSLIKDGAQLTDVCDALSCGDERIDKILIRNSDDLQLEPLRWWVPQEFVDAEDGSDLSDHLPVAADLRYVPT